MPTPAAPTGAMPLAASVPTVALPPGPVTPGPVTPGPITLGPGGTRMNPFEAQTTRIALLTAYQANSPIRPTHPATQPTAEGQPTLASATTGPGTGTTHLPLPGAQPISPVLQIPLPTAPSEITTPLGSGLPPPGAPVMGIPVTGAPVAGAPATGALALPITPPVSLLPAPGVLVTPLVPASLAPGPQVPIPAAGQAPQAPGVVAKRALIPPPSIWLSNPVVGRISGPGGV